MELDGVKTLGNIINDKIQQLEVELEDSITTREKEVLTNEIDTLRCVLGHLFNLKSGDGNTQSIDKQLNKIQDLGSEISTHI